MCSANGGGAIVARNILLRLQGDPTDAQRAVRALADDLRAFAREGATAELRVDATKARATLEATKEELRSLPSEGTFRLDLQIAGAEAKIAQIKTRLESLTSQDPSPKVDIRIGNAVAQLDAAEKKLLDLNGRKAAVTVTVSGLDDLRARLDTVKASLEVFAARKYEGKVGLDIGEALAKAKLLGVEINHATSGGVGARPLHDLEAGLSDIVAVVAKAGEEAAVETEGFLSRIASSAQDAGGAVASGLSSGFKAVAGAAASLSSIGPASIVGLLALGALLPVIGPEIIGLVAAIGALIAVLASAALGAGFLGIALAGAFAPVLAVVVAVVAAITNIVKVTNASRTAAIAVTNALVAQRNARQALAQAEATEGQQAIAAENAKRDAILAVRDAYIQVEQAQLGITDAKLAVDDAKQALKDFYGQVGGTVTALFQKFQNVDPGKIPGLLDSAVKSGQTTADQALQYAHLLENLKTAQVGQQAAADQLTHATNGQADAQATANKFATEGLAAYQPYAASVTATAKAQQSLADATNKLVIAQQNAVKAGAVDQLSASESRFGELFRKIRSDLSGLFGPAEAKVFDGLDVALGDIEKIAANPAIKSGLTAIGAAIGGLFKSLGASLSTKSAQAELGQLEQGGAKLIGTLGKSLPDLLKVVLEIAKDALPLLLQLAGKVGTGFDGFLQGQLKAGVLRHEVDEGVSSFEKLLGLVEAGAKFVAAFFGGGVKPGQDLLSLATKFLNKQTAILDTAKGQANLHNFFADSVDAVRTLYHLMLDIYTVIKDTLAIVSPLTAAVSDINHPSVANTVNLAQKTAGAVSIEGSIAQSLGKLLPASPLPLVGAALKGAGSLLGLVGNSASPKLTAKQIAAASGSAKGSIGLRSATTFNQFVTAPAGESPESAHAIAALKMRLDAAGIG